MLLIQLTRCDAILYLGSDRLLEDKNNRQLVLEMLKASIFKQPELFPRQIPEKLKRLALIYYEKYQIKYGQSQDNPTSIPPSKEQSEFHNTDIKGLEVEDVKEFGAEHLCKQTIEKLGLESFLKGLGLSDHVSTSLISIAAKAIYAASEHKTAQILDINSELAAFSGIHSLLPTSSYTRYQTGYSSIKMLLTGIYMNVCPACSASKTAW
jgi:hypothetical protein